MQKLFRINEWNFATKIGAALILLGVIPVVAVSILLVTSTANALRESDFNELDAVTVAKVEAVRNYMTERFAQSQALADRFQFSGDEAGTLGISVLSAHKNNRNSTEYQVAYESARAAIDSVVAAYPDSFSDILLIDLEGETLLQLDEAHTGETQVASEAFFTEGLKGVYFSGIFHSLTTDEDTAFISRPLYDRSGKLVGVLAIELNLQTLDKLLEERAGLGESGETYLVGQVGDEPVMLTQSRFSETSTRLVQAVNTHGAQEALAGVTGTDTYPDYRGISVLGSHQPIPEYGWALLGEIDQAEVLAATRREILEAAIAVAVAILAAVGIAFLIARGISRQVDELETVFSGVRVGDFDIRAKVLTGDELGRTAQNVNDMLAYMTNLLRGSLARMESIIESASDAIVTVDEDHNVVLFNSTAEQLFGYSAAQAVGQPLTTFIPARFHSAHGRHMQNFSRTGETGRGMGKGRDLTAMRSDGTEFEVEANISQVEVGGSKLFSVIMREITVRRELQSNVGQMVSLLVEQAAASAEMADQATVSARAGETAVSETIAAMNRIRENTQETARRIKRLGEVSKEIGEAVRLIEELSDRTTVLALNASIQAAAAGDAGRGFAVVAEEVQTLAERAAGATRQIEDLVKSIQAETSEAVIGIEDATREVVEGSNLAQQTGDRVGELNKLVADLASLIQHVADTTALQTTESLTALTTGTAVSQPAGSGNGRPQPASLPAGD